MLHSNPKHAAVKALCELGPDAELPSALHGSLCVVRNVGDLSSPLLTPVTAKQLEWPRRPPKVVAMASNQLEGVELDAFSN